MTGILGFLCDLDVLIGLGGGSTPVVIIKVVDTIVAGLLGFAVAMVQCVRRWAPSWCGDVVVVMVEMLTAGCKFL